MTDIRRCASCGTPEVRKTDKQGRACVNLDPITNLCVKCLVAAQTTFRSRRSTPDDGELERFDGRAKAARNDE